MQAQVQDLVRVAREAEEALALTFNAPDVLPFAARALLIIRANPEIQPEFEAEFLDMRSYAPTEFVEVCMHVLRWPSVKTELERRYRAAVAENDWTSESVYRHYLDAFADEWESSEFYGDFFAQQAAA